MSKHKLREDKTCLNCRHVVERRFCPNCGQENSDSRKSFHELFIHFFEDLTHYENAFWKTIKNLLFKPSSLTKEYLSGKRLSYLAPVRLYIFISFLTFLLIGIVPDHEEKLSDNIKVDGGLGTKKEDNQYFIGDFNTVKELEAFQEKQPEDKKLNSFEYWVEKRMTLVKENNKPKEFTEKFSEAFTHNIPKALFLYMPFFAFGLWVFHGKKRWYYFDHGIFTLHYFSFLLLTISIYTLLSYIIGFLPPEASDAIDAILVIFICCWWFFYFFRSHSKFYGERKWISRLKGFTLFFINLFFIVIFMVGLMLYAIVNMH